MLSSFEFSELENFTGISNISDQWCYALYSDVYLKHNQVITGAVVPSDYLLLSFLFGVLLMAFYIVAKERVVK